MKLEVNTFYLLFSNGRRLKRKLVLNLWIKKYAVNFQGKIRIFLFLHKLFYSLISNVFLLIFSWNSLIIKEPCVKANSYFARVLVHPRHRISVHTSPSPRAKSIWITIDICCSHSSIINMRALMRADKRSEECNVFNCSPASVPARAAAAIPI